MMDLLQRVYVVNSIYKNAFTLSTRNEFRINGFGSMVSDVDDVLSGSRSIDMSIADFVELAQRAAKIDRDANPVSVQENSAEAITQAEKVAVGKLEIPHKFGSESEQVTIYGIEPDSAYFDAGVSDGKIVAGTGHTDKEISKLYVRTITLTVLVSLIISLPIVLVFLGWFCELMFMDYSGNFVLNFPQYLLLVEVAIGFVTYLLVAALHMRHIKRVPLAMALKIQE